MYRAHHVSQLRASHQHLQYGEDAGQSFTESVVHFRRLWARHQHLQYGEDVGQAFTEGGVPRLPQPRGFIRPWFPVRRRFPGVDAAKAASRSSRNREAGSPVNTRQWQCGVTILLCAICDCSPVSVTPVIKPLICVLCSQCCSFCLLKSG